MSPVLKRPEGVKRIHETSIRFLSSLAEDGQGDLKEHNAKTGQNQDIHPAVDHPAMRKERLPQGIHGISERQAKTDDLKGYGHGKDREKNSTKEDHGKAEEVGKGHCLEDFSNSNRDQNAQEGEREAGKDQGNK